MNRCPMHADEAEYAKCASCLRADNLCLKAQLSEVTKERDELRANGQNEFDRHAETIAKLETALARVKELETELKAMEADRDMWQGFMSVGAEELREALPPELRSQQYVSAAIWLLRGQLNEALTRAESAEASAAAMRGVLLDVLNEGIDGEYDESTPHRTRAALASTAGTDLLAEMGALREVAVAARRVEKQLDILGTSHPLTMALDALHDIVAARKVKP